MKTETAWNSQQVRQHPWKEKQSQCYRSTMLFDLFLASCSFCFHCAWIYIVDPNAKYLSIYSYFLCTMTAATVTPCSSRLIQWIIIHPKYTLNVKTTISKSASRGKTTLFEQWNEHIHNPEHACIDLKVLHF